MQKIQTKIWKKWWLEHNRKNEIGRKRNKDLLVEKEEGGEGGRRGAEEKKMKKKN